MANEISISASLSFRKGTAGDALYAEDLSVTMTGNRYLKGRQSVGTSEEALVLGEVPAGGWLMLKNTDATNYVQVRAKAGETPFARMRAGEPCGPFRLDASAVPTLQANTAACLVEYELLED